MFGTLVFVASFVTSDAARRLHHEHRAGASSKFAKSILEPIETGKPSELLFPPKNRYPLNPVNTEVAGPKQTNKFWGNWVVEDGANKDFSIFPSPYTLRFRKSGDSPSGVMQVMKGETDYKGDFYTTHWWPDFNLGALESFSGMHTIVKESHFGVHAQVRPAPGSSCSVTYPVYAGMAYVSAEFKGGCTPKITSDFEVKLIEKVSPGIFRFQKKNQNPKEYRIYLLTPTGDFVDDSFDFNSEGTLNQKFDGWVRMADLQKTTDTVVLDRHANTVLVGWELAAGELTDETNIVQYKFETVGPVNGKLLHWAYANHIAFLDTDSAKQEESLTRTRSPVKGKMFPLVSGKEWRFKVDVTDALALGFLPSREPRAEHVDDIVEELQRDWQFFKKDWRLEMHKIDHYFSGKGFQKLAMICQLMRKFDFADTEVTACAQTLKEAFSCMYERTVSDGSDRAHWSQNQEQNKTCRWSAYGTWYDLDWHGIASRGDNSPVCGMDFGNSCYNDHHYHWGYYVVSAAILIDLLPSMKYDSGFTNFINMFIRDASNPSPDDIYFPQFRAFDWFDMHSWSRGLKASDTGKDQESTSEEVNLHYGVLLWGRMLGDRKIEQLGATMLTVASRALQEYFLNKRDNKNHPPSFTKYHVTGIFFQNKVHLTTWFGGKTEYIHGIQMLPLSAGLLLSRTPEFCIEEWEDRLAPLTIDYTDAWWSILFTGNLAMWKPLDAFNELKKMQKMDGGLTKSWALYWTSVQPDSQYVRPPPGPRPTPTPPGGGNPNPVRCAPNQGQLCPGGTPCPPSGVCGDPSSPTPPSPPPAVMCDPRVKDPPQMCPGNIPCPQCGEDACKCP